jgi:hypothetical protein
MVPKKPGLAIELARARFQCDSRRARETLSFSVSTVAPGVRTQHSGSVAAENFHSMIWSVSGLMFHASAGLSRNH